MENLPLIIALGIVFLFGYWSGNRRTKSHKGKQANLSQVYPFPKAKKHTNLRRIK